MISQLDVSCGKYKNIYLGPDIRFVITLNLTMKFSCLNLKTINDSIYTANYEFDKNYANMTIQIYWKKFTTKIKNFR